MDRLYLPILYGTVREPRHSIGVARFALEVLRARPAVETRLFDPRDLRLGDLVTREWEMETRPPVLEEFVREMGRADGFVIVTPEYNHSYPGALKNMIDHLYDEWNRKPFALVTAGGVVGGARAAIALREVLVGVEAIAIPAQLSVPTVQETFDEDGPRTQREVWTRRLHRVFDELEWYARALRPARSPSGPGA